MTIRIVETTEDWEIYDGDHLIRCCLTAGGAQSVARRLANRPKRKYEWEVKRNDKQNIPKSGPTWWMWVLIGLFTVSLCIFSLISY